MRSENRAIFLDRDGVINVEVSYLSDPNDFVFIEGTIQALKILQHKGFFLIIITNQAGIARGYYDEQRLAEIHNKMTSILKEHNIKLDDIFFCPHHPEFTGPCDCRKPKPGMILKAANKHHIHLQESYIVGDTLKDIEAGQNAGCKTVLVLTGYGAQERKKIKQIKPHLIYQNLLEFAKNL